MGNTINVLFALARVEHIASESFDLRGCIEDSLLRMLDQHSAGEERLMLQLPDRLMVMGNRHLSTLLMNNCVSNALFHGEPGAQLALSFAEGVLVVENTVDVAHLGAMQGFQHGQNLLRRIAQAMRWKISFHAGATAYRVEITPQISP